MRASLNPNDLLNILSSCRELVAHSENSDWSCMEVTEVLATLDHSIGRLRESQPMEIDPLRFLFLPTGPLQEISMSNGWAKKYLQLATLFDKSIGESS